MSKKISDQEKIDAIMSSVTIAEALRKIGLSVGGSYRTMHRIIRKYKLDTSHLKGQSWNKGLKRTELMKPIEYYLKYDGPYISSSRLRKRLIDADIFLPKCSMCDMDTWLNRPIPLELDHINGVHFDNRLENLRLLCPNCHALTPTYKGRNINKDNKSRETRCKDCRILIHKTSTCCKSCAGKATRPTKIKWPPMNELLAMLKEEPYTRVAKKLGVSDNAIRKRIKNHT